MSRAIKMVSVLAQTVNDPASPSYAAASWEAICVDDGSTDGSLAILDTAGPLTSEKQIGYNTKS